MEVATAKRMQKVPTMRFAGFSDPWKLYPLGEVGETRGGLTYTPDDVVEHGGTLVLRSSNIQDGQIAFDDCVFVSCEVPKKSIVRDGDILLCVRNGSRQLIGKSLLITKEHAGHAFGAFMSVYRSECSGFVSELMNSHVFYQQVHEHLGATINQITNASLNSFKFYFPTLPEQQKIAAFLGAVDRKIQQLKRKQALLEQYKKGVVQQLFSQELRFKREDGSDYPEWEEKRLGDIGVFTSGVGFPDAEQGGRDGIPFYKVSDMNLPNNEVEMTRANHYVTLEQIHRLRYKPITAPSLVFAKVGAAIFHERKRIAEGFLIDNNMMAFTPRQDIKFIKCLFETVRLAQFAQVGALPSYNGSDLSIIRIKLPCLEEQTRIAGFLMALDAKVAGVAQAVAAAQRWKKGLLQQMFV
jgi:type I restriction enzyme S subunit